MSLRYLQCLTNQNRHEGFGYKISTRASMLLKPNLIILIACWQNCRFHSRGDECSLKDFIRLSDVSAEDHMIGNSGHICPLQSCVEFSSSGAELYRQDVTQKTQMQTSDPTNIYWNEKKTERDISMIVGWTPVRQFLSICPHRAKINPNYWSIFPAILASKACAQTFPKVQPTV